MPSGIALSRQAEPDVQMHMHLPASLKILSSLHQYEVPALTLVNQFGRKVRLDRALDGDKPALVEFFFTTCTTICGVRSAQLVAAQLKLVRAKLDVGLYTISIDPDHDTPGRLLAYSNSFDAPPPPNWHLLTGSKQQVVRIEAAFDASDPSGDKMMHRALTFIRGGAGRPWVRIDGMMTTDQLVRQIETAVATH